MVHLRCTLVLTNILWSGLGLLFFCKNASTSSVWNMPWPVEGYKSYMDIIPMRYDSPAGLASLNFSFSGIKTLSECPEKDIHIIIGNAGLPLVNLSENSLPENFVSPQNPSIELIIKSGQIAELSLSRPPPGPWYIAGYLKDIDSSIKQKGLQPKESCRYLYMSLAKSSAPIESTKIFPGNKINTTITTKGSLFSFTVSQSTINFEVQVTNCQPGPCNLSLSYMTFMSKYSKEVTEDCSNVQNTTGPSCVLHISSPSLHDVQMINIKFMGDNTQSPQNRAVIFKVVLQECLPFVLGLASTSCGLTTPLDRIQSPFHLTTRFGMVHSSTVSLVADLTSAVLTSIPFSVIAPNDVGGTLKWQLRLLFFSHVNVSQQQVCGGLMYNKLPDTSLSGLDLCTADIPGAVNLKRSVSHGSQSNMKPNEVKRYVPYPQAGLWHIVLQTHCFAQDSSTEIHCGDKVLVEMTLEIQQCVDEECSGHGTCDHTTAGGDLVSFSACVCDADYRGYGCTDSRHAQSQAVQLAGAFLLTLSNLFFIPAIIISIRRGFVVEAFVYFFTMFFSTFYHACDGIRIEMYRMCLTQYDVLQLADFFGSSCALWFTIVAMAKITQKHVTGVMQIAGICGLFVGVTYDKTSLCVIAIPILTGLAAITISWGIKMYRTKRLYPSWRRYVFYLIPGVLMATLGGVSFAFLETESNYKYLHSLWHTCVALSIVLLLPPRPACVEKYGPSESALQMSQLSRISYTQDIS
ncbi:hypothetical protein RRG08_033007 [Elysia crispata]|uniref:EGF-like domain-containing protein n=1 Tax=Elysia crispata TaxID=231223 RepID=A0AAE0YS87_9GAST|nr:hypothetical protein RRG08_033007 [Elysia crispata]